MSSLACSPVRVDKDGAVRAGNLSVLVSLSAFDLGDLGGVDVAAGDVDGDGTADIIAGSLAGATHVKALRTDGTEIFSLLAFPGFSGGVRVGFGDADGDGVGEMLAGAGPGAGPHMKAFGPLGAELVSLFGAPVGFLGGIEPA